MNKTFEYFLYFLVFTLPIQTRWIIRAGSLGGEYFENSTISFYGTDIVLLAIIALFAGFKIFNLQSLHFKQYINTKFSIRKSGLFIALIVLSSLISIFFAPDKLVALSVFARLLLGIGLFWIMTGFEYDRIKLIWSFIAGAVLQAGLGIWQFLAQSAFANKWLGLAAHDPSVRGVSVVETMDGHRWLRAYGGLDHPNMLGGLLAVALLLLVYLYLQKADHDFRIPILKKFSNVRKLIAKTLFFVLYFLLFTSLFFTFSRAAWISLAVGSAVMLAGTAIKKEYHYQKELLKIILAGGVIAFVLFNLYGDLASTRIAENTRLEVKSTEERLSSYRDFRPLIKAHGLAGVGIGSYGQAIDRIFPGKSVWYYQPVHNAFLLAWGEAGIFGLLGYLGILGYSGWKALGKFKIQDPRSTIPDEKSVKNLNNATSLALIIIIITISLADHWLWSLHFGVFLFWFSLGVVVNLQKSFEAVK